jgi:nucleoside-diphosphate-sugar epimerase
MRTLEQSPYDVIGTDLKESAFTDKVGSMVDRDHIKQCMKGIDAVIHTATLHKPHIATHSKQAFIDTNITGTLNLLEEAVKEGVTSFVFTSTTSTFGYALTPAKGEPAAWITEEVAPSALARLIPEYKTIYNKLGWKMFPSLDRVYVNELARTELDWKPKYDFASILNRLDAGETPMSPLALLIGKKGYHAEKFSEGPYPVEG